MDAIPPTFDDGADGPSPMPDQTPPTTLLNSLFIEQYKATRAEINTSIQTNQRSIQLTFTIMLAANGIVIGNYTHSTGLNIATGYATAVFFSVIQPLSILVCLIVWSLELHRLGKSVAFLMLLESGINHIASILKPTDQGIGARSVFEGMVLFWEKWSDGEYPKQDRLRIDYVYRIIAFCFPLSAATSFFGGYYVLLSTIESDTTMRSAGDGYNLLSLFFNSDRHVRLFNIENIFPDTIGILFSDSYFSHAKIYIILLNIVGAAFFFFFCLVLLKMNAEVKRLKLAAKRAAGKKEEGGASEPPPAIAA